MLVFKRLKIGLFAIGLVFLFIGSAADPAAVPIEWRQVQNFWNSGAFDEAASMVRSLEADYEDYWEIWYNRGLCSYRAEDLSDAVYSMYRSYRLHPGSLLIRDKLDRMAQEAGLEQQHYESALFSPDILFVAILFFTNLLFFLLGVFLKRQNGGLLVMLISGGLLLIVSLIGFTYLINRNNVATAVLSEDAGLRRVPTADADVWRTLPEGSAVSILATLEDDLLIRTGYGMEGWVERDLLLRIGHGADDE